MKELRKLRRDGSGQVPSYKGEKTRAKGLPRIARERGTALQAEDTALLCGGTHVDVSMSHMILARVRELSATVPAVESSLFFFIQQCRFSPNGVREERLSYAEISGLYLSLQKCASERLRAQKCNRWL